MKWLLSLAFSISMLMADYTAEPLTSKLLASNIKIIDIRTPSEWAETGIVKGSIPIMFFDERGNYDLANFVKELDKNVKKGEKFALICRTGSRTQLLGRHLGTQMGYNVVDLQGGILRAIKINLPIVPYTPKK